MTAEHIDSTRVYCMDCQTFHDARVVRSDREIRGQVECPQGRRDVRLSSDADMFMKFRSGHHGGGRESFHTDGGHLLNLINITNNCNLRCPVCYAACAPEKNPAHLPVKEIVQRARQARKRGARTVSLAGGEPTLHPQLTDAVRQVRELGLRVVIPTNGIALSDMPELASQLKEAGAWKVSIQFDTLDPDVQKAMRGTRAVERKTRAMEHAMQAGLSIGTVTTVTDLNLREVGNILRYGLSLAPALLSMTFQAAAPVGRYELGQASLVDREQIVGQILAANVIPGATLDHIRPLPSFGPWGLDLHPDCAVNILLTADERKIELIDRMVDIDRLYARMARNNMGRHWLARNVVPLAYVLASSRTGYRARLLREIWGCFGQKRQRRIVIVGIGSHVLEDFWDESRVTRCASTVLTEEGPVSPCVLYSGAKKLLHN